MGRAVLVVIRFGFALLGVLGVYLHVLAVKFDVTRESFAARARSVEVSMVPSLIAGPSGRYYDAALEVPLALPEGRVPDFVKNAFITQEDQQFRSFWHFGVNPVTMARAFKAEIEGAEKRFGASTITMQLVKNVLLSQERTYDRKYYQVFLAMLVECLFTKDEILAMYMNTAYFGDGAYGIEAAARRFFGRSVGYAPRINLIEAAMLAASVKSPSRLNPSTGRKLLEERARTLVAAMAEEGYDIGEGQGLRDRGPRTWSMNPYLFRDLAVRFMVPNELRGTEEKLMMSVTVDTEAQLYADLAAVDLLKSARDFGYDSSLIVVMEPDGAVVALAAGHEYDGVDIVRNGRVSPGSTLKPFMYLCALERGMRPDDEVVDSERDWPKNFSGRNYGVVTLKPGADQIVEYDCGAALRDIRRRLLRGLSTARRHRARRSGDPDRGARQSVCLAAGPRERLCGARERRLSGRALRDPLRADLFRRHGLPPPADRKRPAGHRRTRLLRPARDAPQRHVAGRNRTRGRRRSPGLGQDRHQRGAPGCALCRVHRPLCRCGLARAPGARQSEEADQRRRTAGREIRLADGDA